MGVLTKAVDPEEGKEVPPLGGHVYSRRGPPQAHSHTLLSNHLSLLPLSQPPRLLPRPRLSAYLSKLSRKT
jgi:hypothetical protein